MNLEEVKKLNIPKKPGSYQYYDVTGKIIYVGKAADLNSRVLSYWQKSAEHTPAKWKMLKEVAEIKWIETDSEIEALLLESNLIKKHQPQFNVLLRDDKRFAYIKISLEDEVPGVFITRTVDKSGKYFGPFVSTSAVRETIKTLRKVWPYCTERKIGPKPCFYHQVGRCTGVCGGVISRKEYLERVIKPIVLFLEGKKMAVIKEQKAMISKLEKDLKKEKDEIKREKIEWEIKGLKFQLGNIEYVLAHANILGLLDKYATDVVELAKVLGLPKTPQRIEGYDISNTFGQESVGSMVVFAEGEPDKNEYRKFKIKINPDKANDVGMLKEILIRRFAHSEIKNPQSKIENVKEWALPDLIIIDGGKAQANAAKSVLKKHKLDIPIIAISKGLGLRSAIAPDKLFYPGERLPLLLPLASPALHLIKRVRDEAHRFAIGYHRKLRGKSLFDR